VRCCTRHGFSLRATRPLAVRETASRSEQHGLSLGAIDGFARSNRYACSELAPSPITSDSQSDAFGLPVRSLRTPSPQGRTQASSVLLSDLWTERRQSPDGAETILGRRREILRPAHKTGQPCFITFLWQGFHHMAMIFLPDFLYNSFLFPTFANKYRRYVVKTALAPRGLIL